MKLLVIVLCLLSERFIIHSISYQRFSWFKNYALWINRFDEKSKYFSNPWLYFAAMIIPILFVVSIIYLILYKQLFGFAGLILNLLIFYYCLGPGNPFYPSMPEGQTSEIQRAESYFAQVNTELFSLIFWYVVAGPIIALAYRLITLCYDIEQVSLQAKQAKDVLEWIPARITALLYLLVGNFQRGISSFLKYMLVKPDENNILLGQCGVHAAQVTENNEITMIVAEEIVEYATIVLLVLIALFTLGAMI